MTQYLRKLFGQEKDKPTKSRHLREKRVEAKSVFLLNSRLLTLLILVGTFLALIAVSFLGQAPTGPQIYRGQTARTQVIAEFSFSYESELLTQQKIERERKQVPPVYTVNYVHFQDFEVFINDLNNMILDFSNENRNLPRSEQAALLEQALDDYINDSGFELSTDSILTLYRETDYRGRYHLLQQGIFVLWGIYREGIFNPLTSQFSDADRLSYVTIADRSANQREVRFRRPADALLDLRVGLSELNKSEVIYQALFEIMKQGIVVNLIYNEAEHNAQIQAVIDQIEPVMLTVEKGEAIIELGSIVSASDLEKLKAYDLERRSEAQETPLGDFMLERIFHTMIVMLTAILFMRICFGPQDRNNRHYLLLSLMVIANMLIIRMVLELGESSLFPEADEFSTILIYAPPFILAPMTIVILLGVQPALLTVLVVSSFYSMMQGNNIDTFLFVFLTSMVAVGLSHKARVRSKIVRASFMAGLVLVTAVLLQGYFEDQTFGTVLQQCMLIIVLSFVYGMLVVGIVPILESTFKNYSDITLLELTDFNHPLLRRMQIEAPGTYHHSLMVANLAEKAAIEVGANPLVCRTCSLFHDIGKMSKPEYFAENQTMGATNPHDTMKPSMSALVIKNHVSEGVELGRRYSLPKVIIDIIRQHHGTSLIRYFYFQAIKEAQKANEGSESESQVNVDQSNYRYDGPSPQFKESAIVFLADSVEAASRSLKKVTKQNIEDLIDGIFATAQADHQLDNCPLSYQDLARIRSSFIVSILNMLHSRVEYPKSATEQEAKQAPQFPPVQTQTDAS
jgi:putative nucleotidyltransferase with HDIG domain